ncbi:MAG: hypothetical protein H7328_03105 [Bdellovibrio sp.]|nr:hypothetical protein [Bdellovibrio sp.]
MIIDATKIDYFSNLFNDIKKKNSKKAVKASRKNLTTKIIIKKANQERIS